MVASRTAGWAGRGRAVRVHWCARHGCAAPLAVALKQQLSRQLDKTISRHPGRYDAAQFACKHDAMPHRYQPSLSPSELPLCRWPCARRCSPRASAQLCILRFSLRRGHLTLTETSWTGKSPCWQAIPAARSLRSGCQWQAHEAARKAPPSPVLLLLACSCAVCLLPHALQATPSQPGHCVWLGPP